MKTVLRKVCKIKKLVNILFLRGKYVKIRKNTIRFEATASSSVVKDNCKLRARNLQLSFTTDEEAVASKRMVFLRIFTYFPRKKSIFTSFFIYMTAELVKK